MGARKQVTELKALSIGWKISKSLQRNVVSLLGGYFSFFKYVPGQISLLSSINTSKPKGEICANVYPHYKYLFDIFL